MDVLNKYNPNDKLAFGNYLGVATIWINDKEVIDEYWDEEGENDLSKL